MTKDNKLFSQLRASGRMHYTSSLRPKAGENEEAFLQRMAAEGYENVPLEQGHAHWNRDHSEYHAGAADSCGLCKRPTTSQNSDSADLVEPTKVGRPRELKSGMVMLPFYYPSDVAEKMLATRSTHRLKHRCQQGVSSLVPQGTDAAEESQDLDTDSTGQDSHDEEGV